MSWHVTPETGRVNSLKQPRSLFDPRTISNYVSSKADIRQGRIVRCPYGICCVLPLYIYTFFFSVCVCVIISFSPSHKEIPVSLHGCLYCFSKFDDRKNSFQKVVGRYKLYIPINLCRRKRVDKKSWRIFFSFLLFKNIHAKCVKRCEKKIDFQISSNNWLRGYLVS